MMQIEELLVVVRDAHGNGTAIFASGFMQKHSLGSITPNEASALPVATNSVRTTLRMLSKFGSNTSAPQAGVLVSSQSLRCVGQPA
jgi:hypothetical protein